MTKKPQQMNGASAKPRPSPQPQPKKAAPRPPPAKETEKPRLAVTLDGKTLSDDEAREIWVAFSAHMDEHEDDAAGFAKSRGWVSATPSYVKGQAVLVVKTR